MNSLKYQKLNNSEMAKISGGKWETYTTIVSECIGTDQYGNCNKFYVFTYTYEYNPRTREERNRRKDTYNPE